MCKAGGFNLTKFASNSVELLQSIPPVDRANSDSVVNLLDNNPSLERTLGVNWSLCSDTLSFNVVKKDKPVTRRGVLSVISLLTLLCIVENIINSRPLTFVSDDPKDLNPISPNHLLQLRSGPTFPPGFFVKQDQYCRKRWRQVQYLADIFWSRWRSEYLPLLQSRSKWLSTETNLKIDDIVLIVDQDTPRYKWVFGRVTKTFPGKDNLVRSVEVETKQGLFVRPLTKLCLLESYCD
jgi:hypothetical protein